MKYLILYATIEGQTRKIAQTIADQLQANGHEVFLTNCTDPGFCDPATFDAAIMCAPIHHAQYPSAFVRFIKDWKSSLASVPTALVSVTLAIESKNEEERIEAKGFADNLFKETGWHTNSVHHAAGALKYLEYDFFKRWMMRRVVSAEGGPVDTSRDHEMTDWKALASFVDQFTAQQ